MINREMLPAATLDLAEGFKQCLRLGIVLHARLRRIIRQRENFFRAIVFARDDAARFVGRVVPGMGDKLVELMA